MSERAVVVGGSPISAALMAMIRAASPLGRVAPVLIVADPPEPTDTDAERRKTKAAALRERRNQKRVARRAR